MAGPNPIHSASLASRSQLDDGPDNAPEISAQIAIEPASVDAGEGAQPTPTSSTTSSNSATTEPTAPPEEPTEETPVLNDLLEKLQPPANDIDAPVPNDAKSAALATSAKARPRKGLALRTRINLLGYVLSLGCSIGLGLIMLQITAQTLWNNSTHDAHAVAEIVALNSSRTVAYKQMDILEARFESLALFADIRGAILVDPQGEEIIRYINDGLEWDVKKLIADTKRSDQKKIWAMLNGRDWLALETPLIFGHDRVATLYLIWDLSRLQHHLYRLLEASSAVFLVILILVFLATYQLKKSFNKPMDELLRTTADFAEDGTHAHHAVVFANDEMGRLTESYNAMVDRLVSQHNQLSSAHETLEKRVERRTSQLAAQRTAAEVSSKELQRVIDLSLDLLTMIDADGNFIMVSPAVTALLGYTEEQWMACHWEDLMYTPDRVRSGDANIEAKQFLREQGGKLVDAERRMRHRDGHWIWMEWSLTLLDDDGVFMVGRNIQERKKREIEIMVAHKAETIARKRAQQIVDISLDMIITIDASGRFLQVSPAAKRMFGYEPNELLGQRFSDFVENSDFEGDAEKVESLAEAVAAAGGSMSNVLRRFRHKQGHLVWVEWAVVIQPEERSIYAVARDMTERRQQEEQIRLAHEKTQSVINTSRDLIATIRSDGEVLEASAASSQLLGYSPEELIGSNLKSYFQPKDRLESRFEAIPEQLKNSARGISGLMRQFRHADGHWLWMEWNLASRENSDEVHAIGRDVTERVQYEDKLIAAREAAEHATVAKSDFLSNMSHEIRTPLNGVMGMLQLMDDTEVTIEQRGYLRTALNSSDALLTLINDILDFSKMEAGKLLLEDEPFNLIELTEDVVALFGERAAAKGINLSGLLEDNVPSHISGDTTRLRQVLTNVLSNAMKFTKEGEICCRVSLLDDEDPPMLCFDISDTGLGIPIDKQEAIFESFSQADNSTTREFGGTGLGLAISKELVALMQGELSVTSAPGEGSTFSIAIPLHPTKQLPFGNSELVGKRALVVCETVNVRDSIAVTCRRTGMQVIDIPIWEHNLRDLIGDGSAFDIVITDASLIKDKLGAAWVKNPVLPTMVVAPFGKPLEGLSEQFRQMYKPVHSTMLLNYMEDLLKITQIDRSKSTEKVRPPPSKILLVEDNRVNRKVATRMLEKMDMSVSIAVNGQEAVDRLEEQNFDLVLMDCQMPVLDGLAATRQIRFREQREGTPPTLIIALTANVDLQHRRLCVEAGMDDYLAKPFRFDGLAIMLDKWLKPLKEPWID